jgi:hypothetical protein
MVLIVRTFPQVLPFYLRDPLERRTPNVTLDIRITELDGDLFYSSPGQVRPPENPKTLAEFTASWDEDGFRIPAVQADTYPIIALGDSFTEGWLVESPWPDVLAREIGIPVRNLGFLGWSILQEATVMDDYGQGDRQWVLLAYFEGNDLIEIQQSYNYQQEHGNLLEMLQRVRIDMFHPQIKLSEDGNYKYPVPLYIGDQAYELAFHDLYIARLNGARDIFANSRNVLIFREELDKIISDSGNACVGLIYIPTKAHLYLRYADPDARTRVLEETDALELDNQNWLQVARPTTAIDFETWESRLNNQRDEIQEIAAGAGIHFIDLTPEFESAAAQGAMLFYTYDSHWSQAGHDLAGKIVANYIKATQGCPR